MLVPRAVNDPASDMVFENLRVIGFVCATNCAEAYHFTLKSKGDPPINLLAKLLQQNHTLLLFDCISELKIVMAALGVFPYGDRVKFEVCTP